MAQTLLSDNHLFGNSAGAMLSGVGSGVTASLAVSTNGLAMTFNPNTTVTFASGLILGSSNVTGGGIAWPDAWVYRSAANALTIKASSSVTVDGGVLLPSTAGGQDLGSSSFQWRDLQLSRLIQGGTTFGINVNGVANVISINGTAQTSFASGIILGSSNVTGGGIAFGNDTNLYRQSAGAIVVGTKAVTNTVEATNGNDLAFNSLNASLIFKVNGTTDLTITNNAATFASGIILGTSNVTGGGIAFGPDVNLSRSSAGVLLTNAILQSSNYVLSQNGFANNTVGSPTTPAIRVNTTSSAGLYFPGNYAIGFVASGLDVGWAGFPTTTGSSLLAMSGAISAVGTLTLGSGIILGTSNVTGGGIAFGPDVNIYRTSASAVAVNGLSNPELDLRENGTSRGEWYYNGAINFRAISVGMNLWTNGTIAQSIGTNQVTTFASGLVLGTSNVTGGGIAFGNGTNLLRQQDGILAVNHTGTLPGLTLQEAGVEKAAFFTNGGAGFLQTSTAANLVLRTNFATALTIGTDLSVTGARWIAAQSYRAAVSGAAVPVAAGATGTFNIDFTNSAALQTLTITGATLFSGVNYVVGGATTVRINVSGNNAAAVRFPALWNNGWVTDVPTGLATGRFALLTINTFAAADSGAMVAWAVAP